MSYTLGLILSFVLLYKYLALFILVFLAAIILPLPSNAMVIVVGVFCNQGYMDFSLSLLVAISANVFGDTCGYFITWRFGKKVWQKLTHKRPAYFDLLEKYLHNYAIWTIILTRFSNAVGIIVNLFCGLTKYSFKKFILADITGNFLNMVSMLILGYLVGEYWNKAASIVNWVGIGLGIILIIFAWYKIQSWKKKRSAA